MKRIISILLVTVILLSLGACTENTSVPISEVNSIFEVTPTPTPTPTHTATPTPKATDIPEITPAPPQQSQLTIQFIDVGQADSALVMCDGANMLIDGGNAADSDIIYSVLKARSISNLDYIVATHPDEDHVGGLNGALNYAEVDTVYSPVITHPTEVFEDFVDFLGAQGTAITVPSPGDSFKLGSSDVEILAPLWHYSESNDNSIVLKITHGENSFLFTGDAGREAEEDILEAGYNLSATVLKVGHHGSESSTTYPFLREIMPKYAVISCGADNQYGHPNENLLSRLRDADVKVYRTDMQGDVTCISDGKTLEFITGRNSDVETNPTATATPSPTPEVTPEATPIEENVAEIVLRTRTGKRYHLYECSRGTYWEVTLDEALSAGLTPCQKCF